MEFIIPEILGLIEEVFVNGFENDHHSERSMR